MAGEGARGPNQSGDWSPHPKELDLLIKWPRAGVHSPYAGLIDHPEF
jgi:hypothetical protein